ncbi:MAG: cofactor-independent phosphoglycerate mutase [Oscillospiraceae bacterium]|nr:cofactor-independent phosphoglycerate mutase [Oscillospiraceae bacterium]
MKYLVLLCDGMADYPCNELGGQTPMKLAKKPNIDFCAANGEVGLVRTVADGFKPGSDVANLSVMGYDPHLYYTGRSPLEAASIGVKMDSSDIATRCNLVTLSDEENYADKTMVDYCADDISSQEAKELVEFLEDKLSEDDLHFYVGVSYRHCLVLKNGVGGNFEATPPHDISGRKITDYLPKNERFLALMKKSHELLKDHPVNLKRVEKGLRPANSIWLWGSGNKSEMPSFESKYGLKGCVISAVDLIKGIGKLTEMQSIDVDGATGYIDTNFEGKAEAAVSAFENGVDLVYLHVEAPDECGHRYEVENKIRAIEYIDERILDRVKKYLDECGEDYKIMILPDHATPLKLKTHVSDPVPFVIYHKNRPVNSQVSSVNEESAKTTGIFVEQGPDMMGRFINK